MNLLAYILLAIVPLFELVQPVVCNRPLAAASERKLKTFLSSKLGSAVVYGSMTISILQI